MYKNTKYNLHFQKAIINPNSFLLKPGHDQQERWSRMGSATKQDSWETKKLLEIENKPPGNRIIYRGEPEIED